MRILTVNDFWGIAAGSEKVASEEHLRWAAAGHETRFACGSRHPLGSPADDTVEDQIWVSPAGHASVTEERSPDEAAGELLERVRSFSPDVIHVHKCHHLPLVRELAAGWPLVWTFHDHGFSCPGGTRLHRRSDRICERRVGAGCLALAMSERCASRRPARLWGALQHSRRAMSLARRAPAVRVLSDSMRRELVNEGVPNDRIHRIPPPVPIERLTPVPDHPTVLFLGRLVPEKGAHLLLAALARVRRDARLVVAGDGPESDRLAALAARLGLADRVTFTGWLNAEGCRDRLRGSSLLVFPSLWPEPYGLAGPEAMAAGVPVVAFDVGGVRDWLRDGEGGILVTRGDVEGLAASIDRILGDESLRREMGNRGRERVARENDPDRCYQALESLLSHTAAGTAPVAAAPAPVAAAT